MIRTANLPMATRSCGQPAEFTRLNCAVGGHLGLAKQATLVDTLTDWRNSEDGRLARRITAAALHSRQLVATRRCRSRRSGRRSLCHRWWRPQPHSTLACGTHTSPRRRNGELLLLHPQLRLSRSSRSRHLAKPGPPPPWPRIAPSFSPARAQAPLVRWTLLPRCHPSTAAMRRACCTVSRRRRLRTIPFLRYLPSPMIDKHPITALSCA
mmetsp:Transcript_7388/g.16200  ORF Transcript_7388/g.16200 Transcript_7388/m.16200 type:complete len:210 (+) Transcript_7388:3924-4553(+)